MWIYAFRRHQSNSGMYIKQKEASQEDSAKYLDVYFDSIHLKISYTAKDQKYTDDIKGNVLDSRKTLEIYASKQTLI